VKRFHWPIKFLFPERNMDETEQASNKLLAVTELGSDTRMGEAKRSGTGQTGGWPEHK